jgi:hypothetical protein
VDQFLLQMEWDAALIAAWHAEPTLRWPVKMHVVVNRFREKRAGLCHDEFSALKRVPAWSGRHYLMTVRVFTAGCLPRLSDRLWDNGAADAALVLWLSDSDIDTTRFSGGKNQSPKRNTKAFTRSTRFVDVHAGHRRRDWNVCKA